MKKIFTILLMVGISITSYAQTIDETQFKEDIIALYNAGMKSFKSNKEGESMAEDGGLKHFKSNLSLNGAKETYITEDGEKNYKYVAKYTLKNVRDPQAKTEEIAQLIADATAEFGLEKGSTTDIKYLGYKKHTIEFPADNIDDMGKHTSFSLGLIDDGNPMSFEIVVTEILWK